MHGAALRVAPRQAASSGKTSPCDFYTQKIRFSDDINVTAMKIASLILIVIALAAGIALGQIPPPELGKQPGPPADNRVEVRFALNKKAVKCKHFYLSAKYEGEEFFSGEFSSGFQIPTDIRYYPREDDFELEIKCNNHRWYFKEVPFPALSQGYWWVGTDKPPFIWNLDWPKFKDFAWINYLIVDPTHKVGFTVYKGCPYDLTDDKDGPCYDDSILTIPQKAEQK